jgi:hypothetical protein
MPFRRCLDCPGAMTCAICETCEAHCSTGGSGPCAMAHDATMPDRKVERQAAMDELAAENGLQRCDCGGLEDPARPHRHFAAF